MAIDSRNKRASALNSSPMLVMPTADGTTDANDRQQMTWLYSGWVATIIEIVIQTPARRTFRVPYQARWFLVEFYERLVRIPHEKRTLVE